jgi:CyaY protein
MITDVEFEKIFEQTLLNIEEAVDEIEVIDIDGGSDGLLTLSFVNQASNSKIIISKQKPLHQLWIAAKIGGFHLGYDELSQTWKTDDAQGKAAQGEELFELLSRLCSEHAGQAIRLKKYDE